MRFKTWLSVLKVGACCCLAAGASVAATAEYEIAAQGWSAEDRRGWYRGTQGSRLIPAAWFDALERQDSMAPFKERAFLEDFGLLFDNASAGDLPVGFAIDRQDDEEFHVTRLRWYRSQGGIGDAAEPWLGLNCAACHTAEIAYEGRRLRIDGGPGLFDFQSFLDALDGALLATGRQQDKFDRFAERVLGARDDAANRALLKQALDALNAWQQDARARNATPLRYGFARVDAFGFIFNKVLMFAGTPAGHGNPADAPVSYPFLWGIGEQKRVQWNGIAGNASLGLGDRDILDYGALGRNSGEVLGVFGELVVGAAPKLTDGFTSSIDVTNLNRMENVVRKLDPPAWPAMLPLDPDHIALARRGRALFQRECNSCHLLPENRLAGAPVERMQVLRLQEARNRTDPAMACNAFHYEGSTGRMAGMRNGFSLLAWFNPRLGQSAPVSALLDASVKGALVRKASDVVSSGIENFFGIDAPIVVHDTKSTRPEMFPTPCLEITEPPGTEIIAYKARPLDGIWATAPYLHNGSVPTLYHLLLPAAQRPQRFWVGSREYDPRLVGYVWESQPAGPAFEFRVTNAQGQVIRGNSNAGHEYAADTLSDADRWALVEFMKTL